MTQHSLCSESGQPGSQPRGPAKNEDLERFSSTAEALKVLTATLDGGGAWKQLIDQIRVKPPLGGSGIARKDLQTIKQVNNQ